MKLRTQEPQQPTSRFAPPVPVADARAIDTDNVPVRKATRDSYTTDAEDAESGVRTLSIVPNAPNDATDAESRSGDGAGADGELGSHEDRVALRAYLLFLNRSDQDGDSLGDWLEAERQLRREAGDLD